MNACRTVPYAHRAPDSTDTGTRRRRAPVNSVRLQQSYETASASPLVNVINPSPENFPLPRVQPQIVASSATSFTSVASFVRVKSDSASSHVSSTLPSAPTHSTSKSPICRSNIELSTIRSILDGHVWLNCKFSKTTQTFAKPVQAPLNASQSKAVFAVSVVSNVPINVPTKSYISISESV